MTKSVLFTCLLAGSVSWAQTGSVNLLDGTGSPLSTHASITEAYTAIPATLTQAYIIELDATYTGSAETYPVTFGLKAGASASNTITVRPALGAGALAISGNVSGNPVVLLNDADYVILDGRPGGQGTSGTLTIENLATSSSSNTVSLTNGATFNVVRYCNILNGTSGSAGRGIHFGTSASNVSGNSDNLVEYCFFPSGRYRINSNGTSANPNTRNTIRTSSFENMTFVGIWGQSGTGKMIIDSCTFYGTTASGDGLFFGILFDSQNDTTNISNNYMYDLQDANSGTVRYIQIRSTASGGTNLTRIYNNMLSINAGNESNTNVAAIEYSGSSPVYGKIWNNSIYVGGTQTAAGSAGSVSSAGIIINSSSTASAYEIKNNIVTNQRTGGSSVSHVAYSVPQTGNTMDADYNSYSAGSGELVSYGGTIYTDITNYQSVVAPAEVNTNDEQVTFVSLTDLHLDATELGNPALQGTPLTYITEDIDGDLRTYPYRGADEGMSVGNPCTGAPSAGATMASADTLCLNEPFTVYINSSEGDGITYQWQISNDGTTFTSISGATDTLYSGNLSGTSYFRCAVTCTNSGFTDLSIVEDIVLQNAPSGGTINATSNGLNFDFSVTGMTGNYSYDWSFGDGDSSADPAPSHTYAGNGSYTVQLIISNDCGSDTLEYTVTLTLGLADLESGSGFIVYPNPVGDVINLSASGYEGAVSLRILDLSGRVHASWAKVTVPAELAIGDLQLAAGLYMLEIEKNGMRAAVRFEKK